ncbi:hypothetical protein HIJ22_002966 [Escherichia coli]|nr:hypothetical protein [Escherichia coli]
MAKSLVHQLQAEAIDDTASLSSLLMKAKLVASKLALEDIAEWVEFELYALVSVLDSGWVNGCPTLTAH